MKIRKSGNLCVIKETKYFRLSKEFGNSIIESPKPIRSHLYLQVCTRVLILQLQLVINLSYKTKTNIVVTYTPSKTCTNQTVYQNRQLLILSSGYKHMISGYKQVYKNICICHTSASHLLPTDNFYNPTQIFCI